MTIHPKDNPSPLKVLKGQVPVIQDCYVCDCPFSQVNKETGIILCKDINCKSNLCYDNSTCKTKESIEVTFSDKIYREHCWETILHYGKYKGFALSEIRDKDIWYLKTLLENDYMYGRQYESLVTLIYDIINHYESVHNGTKYLKNMEMVKDIDELLESL